MSRRFLIGANVKMNQTPAESVQFFTGIADAVRLQLPDAPPVQLYLALPFTSLPALARQAIGSPIWVSAQNVHWEAEGAYTGEISARMLTAVGVRLVLIGHAERRQLGHETEVETNRKVMAASAAGLNVLLCVGETAEERGYGVGPQTVDRQLRIALHGLAPDLLSFIHLAYEPVWSIGVGGTPATPADITPIINDMRRTMVTLFGEAGDSVPILYGGSVNAENAGTFAGLREVDGLLVGRAGWTVDGFLGVLKAAVSARSS